MFDFAYDQLKKILKYGQAFGQLDVCDGCIYQQNQKCTFDGDAMNAQLPAGCPKRPDTQKVMRLRDDMMKESQAFAPGPGPWEGNAASPITEEVARSSPERSGLGPFESRSQTHAHTDIHQSPGSIAEDANGRCKNPTSCTVHIKKGQAPGQPQSLNPAPIQQNPNQGMQPTGTPCPQCGANIPPGNTACPQCGYNLTAGQQNTLPQQQMVGYAQAYRLCYFCGQPLTGNDQFTIIWDSSGEERLGVGHLTCAQTAAEQQQGEFDDQDDFHIVEDAEKEKPSFEEGEMGEFEPFDEVVLTDNFEGLKSGDLGRVVSDEEASEAGLSPIRVDDKVYVKFDNTPNMIKVVPIDVIEKSSGFDVIKKIAITRPCPYGHVVTVLTAMDHCYLATDDPDDIFGCHDKRCQYHQPTSKAEWDRLIRMETSNPFSVMKPYF